MRNLILFFAFAICSNFTTSAQTCEEFKLGKFILTVNDRPDLPDLYIVRYDDRQGEVATDGGTAFSMIEWVDDCHYILWDGEDGVKDKNSIVNNNGGIHVYMLDPANDNCLNYRSEFLYEEEYIVYEGTMCHRE